MRRIERVFTDRLWRSRLIWLILLRKFHLIAEDVSILHFKTRTLGIAIDYVWYEIWPFFKISDSASIKINRLRSRYISIIFAISDKLLIGKACSPSVSAGDLWPRRSAVSWLYCCLPQDYSIIDTSCPSLRGTLTKNTSKHWFRFGAVIFLLSGNINELHFAPREIFYKDAWMTLSNIVGLM